MKNLILIFLVVLGLYFYLVINENQEPKPPVKATVQAENRAPERAVETVALDQSTPHSKKKPITVHVVLEEKACMPPEERKAFFTSETAQIAHNWMRDIGSLKLTYSDRENNLYINQHPYTGYPLSVIQELASENDSLALHTLGVIALRKAFNNTIPDELIQIFDLETLKHNEHLQVDMSEFNKGIRLLERAAAAGRIEAFGDISVYYSYLFVWEEKNGNDKEKLEDYEVRIFAYDRVRARIIPSLDYMDLDTPHPKEDKIESLTNLVEERYLESVQTNGFNIPQAPVEYLELMSVVGTPECKPN